MLTDDQLKDIEAAIAAVKATPPTFEIDRAKVWDLVVCGETLLAEVKKLRADMRGQTRVSRLDTDAPWIPLSTDAPLEKSIVWTRDATRAVALAIWRHQRFYFAEHPDLEVSPTPIEWKRPAIGDARLTDIVHFRTFFDSFSIDYHVETHYGPNGSPIKGAACSIELGSSAEFAFDTEGRFLGWCEFEAGGVVEFEETNIHLRADQ